MNSRINNGSSRVRSACRKHNHNHSNHKLSSCHIIAIKSLVRDSSKTSSSGKLRISMKNCSSSGGSSSSSRSSSSSGGSSSSSSSRM